MKLYRLAAFFFVPLLLVCFSVGPALADRGPRDGGRRDGGRDYVFDKRHHHNQYYPRHGYVVNRIPDRHYRTMYHGTSYYFSSGVWYRPYGSSFTVIAPPIGVVVPILPRVYTTVWYGEVPYYYADGAYYRWYPAERGYIVVNPPEDIDRYDQPEVPDELFVYPRSGQKADQQALDRYECHRWAVDESGFDPTRAGGGVPVSESTDRRSNYNRATKACLEARGYSVE